MMDLPEARRILFAATCMWGSAKLEEQAADKLALRSLSGPPHNLPKLRKELQMRTEILDAAVVQYARELARVER